VRSSVPLLLLSLTVLAACQDTRNMRQGEGGDEGCICDGCPGTSGDRLDECLACRGVP